MKGDRPDAAGDDFQVFSKEEGGQRVELTVSRDVLLLAASERERDEGAFGIEIKGAMSDLLVDEFMQRVELRNSMPASSAEAQEKNKTGTAPGATGCGLLYAAVWKQDVYSPAGGRWYKVVEKDGCFEVVSGTGSEGLEGDRRLYGVHFRQESLPYRGNMPDSGVAYYTELDDMDIRVEPWSMNFLWTGDVKKPSTRGTVDHTSSPWAQCNSQFDLTIPVYAGVTAGKTIEACEYNYVDWSAGSYFYYFQNEWRSESKDSRNLGLSFGVKRGGASRDSWAFTFTNALWYDEYHNLGIGWSQYCNNCQVPA